MSSPSKPAPSSSTSSPGPSSSPSSSASTSPLPPPPSPPRPPLPLREVNVNLLYCFAGYWPLVTNPLTVLQTRCIAHSSFLPTYLSPLHPSAAASFARHPTYVLYRSARDASLRSLWSHEGLRGAYRGLVPNIASIALRAHMLSAPPAQQVDLDIDRLLASSRAAAAAAAAAATGGSSPFAASDGDSAWAAELNLYVPDLNARVAPLATLAAYPLDHVRTLMQLTQHGTLATPAPHSAGAAVDYVLSSTSTSFMATLRALVAQHGVTAVYRGVLPALVGQAALVGSGLRLFDEALLAMQPSVGDDQAEEDSEAGERGERKAVFPLSLIDRLSNSPPLVSSALLFLASYLLVFYPATVVSTHMRASLFTAAHVAPQPLVPLPPQHPAASHHLHAYASASPPYSAHASSGGLPGAMATIRRIGVEQGVRGFYRGFSLHLAKVVVAGTWVGGIAGMLWLTKQMEEDD